MVGCSFHVRSGRALLQRSFVFDCGSLSDVASKMTRESMFEIHKDCVC